MLQCEDLTKVLLVSKFEMNWPNIKLIVTFCAIWRPPIMSRICSHLWEVVAYQRSDHRRV